MQPPDGPLLSIEGVTKSFGDTTVLREISLDIRKGEFLTFLGPSGCGKTTTLRIIAGFEAPDCGRILLEGQDITGLPPYRRDVHTVFQHYALFPHYTVFNNVAFGLRIRRVPEAEIGKRVREALSLVKLSGFEERQTTQMSGGQMQRVALARALIGRPAVLLLDEPLGALDLKLRKEMQLELKTLQRRLGITFVYVTHDQEEAMTMSDRIAVFNKGVIEQLGAPAQIYERPKTSFVADFIGAANVFSARVLDAQGGRLRLRLEERVEFELLVEEPSAYPAGTIFKLAIRPERVTVRYREDEPAAPGALRLPAVLAENVYLGNASQIYLQPFGEGGKTLLAVSMDSQHRAPRAAGSPAWADIRLEDILMLEPVGQWTNAATPAETSFA